jgi:hypothetical protein
VSDAAAASRATNRERVKDGRALTDGDLRVEAALEDVAPGDLLLGRLNHLVDLVVLALRAAEPLRAGHEVGAVCDVHHKERRDREQLSAERVGEAEAPQRGGVGDHPLGQPSVQLQQLLCIRDQRRDQLRRRAPQALHERVHDEREVALVLALSLDEFDGH